MPPRDAAYAVAGARLSLEKVSGPGSLGYRDITEFFSGTGQASVSYEARTQEYTLGYRRDPAGTVREDLVFRPAEITSTTSAGVVYSKADAAGARDVFTRGHLTLTTQYVAAGRWETFGAPRSSGSDTLTSEIYRYFVFGNETVPTDVPRSGTLNYNYEGIEVAFTSQSSRGVQLRPSQPAQLFTLDLANGQFSGTLSAPAVCQAAAVSCEPLRVTGNLVAGGARVQGTVTEAQGRVTGTFEGALYGPSGREFGIVLLLQGPNGSRSVAHVLGKSS